MVAGKQWLHLHVPTCRIPEEGGWQHVRRGRRARRGGITLAPPTPPHGWIADSVTPTHPPTLIHRHPDWPRTRNTDSRMIFQRHGPHLCSVGVEYAYPLCSLPSFLVTHMVREEHRSSQPGHKNAENVAVRRNTNQNVDRSKNTSAWSFLDDVAYSGYVNGLNVRSKAIMRLLLMRF